MDWLSTGPYAQAPWGVALEPLDHPTCGATLTEIETARELGRLFRRARG